jgi:acetylornithine/N-succinyldiaminopimelate aminotransferase
VFFTNSGAEAVECAIKTARRYHYANGNPAAAQLITFANAFHGRTLGAISATNQPKMRDGFEPLLPGFDRMRVQRSRSGARAIDDNTAGFLVEPIQGEGGMTRDPEFLKGLRKACDEHGLLLILDEVQCGYGRTGKFFAHEHYGITPDIMAVAKGIGGGFPLGACLATEEAAKGMVDRHARLDLWRQPAGDGGGRGDARRDLSPASSKMSQDGRPAAPGARADDPQS